MPKKAIILLLLGCLTAVFLGARQATGPAAAGGTLRADLKPIWTTGILSDNVGLAGILVADFNGDASTDLFTCAADAPYVLNESGNRYIPIWYGERYPCRFVAAGDRDDDGNDELYILATPPGRNVIHVVNPLDDFLTIASLTLPSAITPTGFAAGNVDADAAAELVVVESGATHVYDASTLTLEWMAVGNGGEGVAIGDTDGIAPAEIVVGGTPAYVLDAAAQDVRAVYPAGLGDDFALGDVDGDGNVEIASITASGAATVFDPFTGQVVWDRDDLPPAGRVLIADIDGDLLGEVIIGDTGFGFVTVYDGQTGQQLSQIANPVLNVNGLGAGDVDDDGTTEIIWGGGAGNESPDALLVGEWGPEQISWRSDDLDGPLYAAAGDVDADGVPEIVVASRTTSSNFDGGTIRAYNGVNRVLEWSLLTGNSSFDIYALELANIDADAELEILVAAGRFNNTHLRAYDGDGLVVDWASGPIAPGLPRALAATDVDSDALAEPALALANQTVILYDDAAAGSGVLWQSVDLGAPINDLQFAELDGDKNLELLVLTADRLVVLDVSDGVEEYSTAVTDGRRLALLPATLPATALVVIAEGTPGGAQSLAALAFESGSFTDLWTYNLSEAIVESLVSDDIDGDGDVELIVLGAADPDDPAESLLLMGTSVDDNRFAPEYQADGRWGPIYTVTVADIDDDGADEFLFGAETLVQLSDIAVVEVVIRTVNLPLVSYPLTGWETLIREDFEGAFPGPWAIFDTNPGGGTHTWAPRDCQPFAGNFSGWAVGGTDGAALPCDANYPDNVASAMIFGPFTLENMLDADMRYQLSLNTIPNEDLFCQIASVDGQNFFGDCFSGSAPAWTQQELDLTAVTGLGNLLGQDTVWVGLLLLTNGSGNLPGGAYADNITIRRCVSAPCLPAATMKSQLDATPIGIELHAGSSTGGK